MGCCGKTRTAIPVENTEVQSFSYVPPAPTVRYFQYTGKTALTAIGSATGQRYRFASSGAQVAVDSRDAPSMMGVPHLRRLEREE